MFIIATIIGLYGWITIAVEDIILTFEFFDTFISSILSFVAVVLGFVLFIIAWKRKMILENDCEKDYKSILEANSNIEIDNAYQSDEDFEKLSKEEYMNAGFKYAEEKHGYLYILFNKLDLYFEYSKLIEYNEYKKFYSNISLIAELSEFIYDNINNFS